jgi:hypothetical protein
MHFRRMTVLELAVACGNPKHRHTISHLHAGTRNTCSVHLARRIQEALNIPQSALFDLYVPGFNVDSQTTRGHRAA